MNTNKKIGYIILAVVIAVGLFYGGTKFGEMRMSGARSGMASSQFGGRTSGTAGGFAGRTGQASGRFNVANGGATAGQVISMDDKSITVKLPDGGSKIIFTSPSTTVLKFEQGTIADVSVGTNVSVQGSANTDGSVTAQSIQIRPATSTQPMMTGSQAQPIR